MCKVLYVAGAFAGSTTLDRRDGLVASGWEIFHLSTDPWVRHPSRLWRGLHFRLNYGPLIADLNRSVRVAATQDKPKIVWIDKGTWIWAETIDFLKSLDMLVVHFTPDSIRFPFHSTRNFMKSIPCYDMVITTKEWEVNHYKLLGAKRVFFTHQGSSPSRTRPMSNPERRFVSDVVFIGRGEAHYVETIRRIANLLPGIDLKVWGDWSRPARKYSDIRKFWQRGGVYGHDYASAISGSKIGLGLLSKIIPETETTRSFEIPACRTMFLAERTEAHKRLYNEGLEADFFDDADEAAAKIAYYLERPAERIKISNEGYVRYINSDYTTERFMKDCVQEIITIMGES